MKTNNAWYLNGTVLISHDSEELEKLYKLKSKNFQKELINGNESIKITWHHIDCYHTDLEKYNDGYSISGDAHLFIKDDLLVFGSSKIYYAANEYWKTPEEAKRFIDSLPLWDFSNYETVHSDRNSPIINCKNGKELSALESEPFFKSLYKS